MQKHIPAVYENGVFRPLTHLQLPEHQAVHLIVEEEEECSESMETLAMQGASFDFLAGADQDVYSISDGRPLD